MPVTHAPEVHVPNDTVLDYEASFVRDRPGSAALYARAGEVFPSGVTHDARYLSPFPLYMRDASGPYKWDVDGHRYIDYAIGRIRDAVSKLRELSPLWEMYQDGVDLNTIQWTAH